MFIPLALKQSLLSEYMVNSKFRLSFRNDSSPVGVLLYFFPSHILRGAEERILASMLSPGHKGLPDSPGHWSPLTDVSQGVSGL